MTIKNLNRIFKNNFVGKGILFIGIVILIYLFCSMYFINHCFINTKVNGINLSLKNYKDINNIVDESTKEFSLKIVGRDGRTEVINGKDIGIQVNDIDVRKIITKGQNPIMWIKSLISKEDYYIDQLFKYDSKKIDDFINNFEILNKDIQNPVNVSFYYDDGIYEIEPEIYGNKIYKDKLKEVINEYIDKGISLINLEKNNCYENPIYTSESDKATEVIDLLNKYISTKITYVFGEEKEILDSNIINKWLSVNENLDIVIDENSLSEYISSLSKKYNTIGITRKFKTSTGKTVDVEGGYYGWKINSTAEKKLLIDYVKLGAIIEKEPTYSQKALYRDKDDIGNTYVEINISRQYMWFYKEGKLIAEGSVVTGDERKGYSTTKGTYMINYKQKEAVLRGPGYESKVNYWMPFNGNIGIHDASWRSSFGYDIYKHNGTHGCVNSPLNLAKKIYENIEAGTPVICYEE